MACALTQGHAFQIHAVKYGDHSQLSDSSTYSTWSIRIWNRVISHWPWTSIMITGPCHLISGPPVTIHRQCLCISKSMSNQTRSSTASFSHIHDYCPQKCTIFSISQGASRSLKSIGMWRKKKDAFPIVAGILKLLVEILQRESAPGRSCWKPAKSLKDRLCSWGESACWSHHREFICMHPLVKWAGASWMLSDAATITHHNLLIECSQWYSRDCFVL